MDQPLPTPAEALEELQELLHRASGDEALPRTAGGRYTICRDSLLKSELRPSLPGFLVQCLTISRFHDFIHLLDPRPEVRRMFLEAAFQNVAGRLRERPAFDVFGDTDF